MRAASRRRLPGRGRGKITGMMKSMLRSMLTMRPLPHRRFVFAARSGLCMGVPVLVGWLAGDLMAGMMAATGGFTALYGRGRPYRSRAVELALVALALALVVAIGSAVSTVAWAVVPTVAVIAMLSTWLGNALRIGPPGAYMFMMACAAATAMPAVTRPRAPPSSPCRRACPVSWKRRSPGSAAPWNPPAPERPDPPLPG